MKKLLTIVIMMGALSASAQQTGERSPYIQTVDEYVPAPGQFVNTMPEYEEGDDAQSMAAKCTQLLANNAGGLVTLGAYGGYIVFHFDHPVVNVAGQRDFAVWGNAFVNNAEPAIVMVAVDANGNGKPDDEWYELRGSEYASSATIHNYEITYVYEAMKSVKWTDNQGKEGVVERNSFHGQEYFPQWLASQGSLTFRGARLANNAQWSVYQFILPAYDYGYADNQPNLVNSEPNVEGCGMDISWAVDSEGNPVTLTHIDFVKCYNAMNQQCPNIGETSTEITGAEDLHPDATTGISPIGQDVQKSSAPYYDLRGRSVSNPSRGLYMRNGKKYIIK